VQPAGESGTNAAAAAVGARPNSFDVDLGAIAHNVGVLRDVLPGGTRICAAVKANAYGFGLLPVARTLVDAGVDALGLVDIRDAVRLREDGVPCPILLYGGNLLDERTMPRIREHDLIVTVGDDRSLAVAASFGKQAPTRVFVEVDVGLERLGVSIDEAAGLLRAAASSGAISLEGVYTHMHVPPDAEPQYLDWQFGRFQALLSAVQSEGYSTGIAMAASSPVLFRTTAMSLDAVDVGRYLYGIVRPGAEPGLAELGLRPAFVSLRSLITHCKRIDRRDYLDATPFAVHPGMQVGVVPMGFADGLAFLTCGAALVRGVRAPLLGGLSLEHVSLDVAGIPGVAAGDEVVFIGRQEGAEITQEEVVANQRAGLPPALLSAAVRETVPRVYRGTNSRPSPAAGRRYTPFVESANDVSTD
jgi:alanine racemase